MRIEVTEQTTAAIPISVGNDISDVIRYQEGKKKKKNTF